MGVDLDRGPITNLDNKLAEDMSERQQNIMSQSIAEKTAKLHRLLGDSDKEKGFHLGERIQSKDLHLAVRIKLNFLPRFRVSRK